jgi:hypothetical protein
LLEPLVGAADAEIDLTVSSETGGEDSGIDVRWQATLRRGDEILSAQSLAIGRGFLA